MIPFLLNQDKLQVITGSKSSESIGRSMGYPMLLPHPIANDSRACRARSISEKAALL